MISASMKEREIKPDTGHALVVLLFFMVLSVTVITAAVSLLIINSSSTTYYLQASEAKTIAEAGVENALLRLLRDPSYSGESVVIGEGTAEIIVTGTTDKTILSEGVLENRKKRIEVTAQVSNNIVNILSWKEIP